MPLDHSFGFKRVRISRVFGSLLQSVCAARGIYDTLDSEIPHQPTTSQQQLCKLIYLIHRKYAENS